MVGYFVCFAAGIMLAFLGEPAAAWAPFNSAGWILVGLAAILDELRKGRR